MVVGTDNDPVALRVARENAAVNAALIDIRPEIPEGITFDLVIANILANTLVELAPQLIGALAPRGRLVLSGILGSQVAEVEAAYRGDWESTPTVSHEGDWACLELEHVAG